MKTLALSALTLTLVLFAAPRAQQTDTKKWDVTADLGPTQKLAFDTSEGT
jgi:hypothetical protein